MGGGGTVDTGKKPWEEAQGYLIEQMERSQRLSNEQRQYYGDQSVAQRSDISAGADVASAGLLDRGGYMGDARNMLGRTLRGEYLDPATNPHLNATYDAGASRMTRHFQRGVDPAISARFAAAGGTSSPGEARARGQAQQEFGDSLGNYANQIYGGNYARERGLMSNAAGLAQGQRASDRADIGASYASGASQEGYQQQLINDLMNRFNFAQGEGDERLNRYIDQVGAASGGYYEQESPVPGGGGAGQLIAGAATSALGAYFSGGASLAAPGGAGASLGLIGG